MIAKVRLRWFWGTFARFVICAPASMLPISGVPKNAASCSRC
jgi:hypothetical protein